MFSKNIFSERLSKLRASKGIKQSDLAIIVGVKNTTISMMESGQRGPSAETLCALAECFGVSTDYLLGAEAPESPAVSPEELELIERYRALDPEKQRAIDALMK